VVGIAPSSGDHTLNITGHGMGEVIAADLLVLTVVIGAIPVAYKAAQDHSSEEDDVASEKQDGGYDDFKA